MKKLAYCLMMMLAAPALAQTAAISGYCNLGATQAATSGLDSSNYMQGIIPYCTVKVYVHGWLSPITASYTSGGTITGASGQTCSVSFDGGSPAGGGTVTLTGSNTIASGTGISINYWGNYSTAPGTATLTSGSATCSGDATVSTSLGPSTATIYADGNNTPLSNPFTANTDGSWLFYAAISQGYDVVLSGGVSPNVYTTPRTVTGLYPGTSSTGSVTSIIPGANITCNPDVSGSCIGDVTISAMAGLSGATVAVTGDSSIGDDNHTLGAAITVTGINCNGAVCICTNSGSNGLVAGEWVDIQGITSPSFLNVGNAITTGVSFFQVLAAGLSSTQFEFAYTANSGTGTGGTAYIASNDLPFQLVQKSAFNGYSNLYVHAATIYALSTGGYTTYFHPQSPSQTGKPGYLFVLSDEDVYFTAYTGNCSAAAVEGYYRTTWAAAHADGWNIIQSTTKPSTAMFNSVASCSGAESIWSAVNIWLRAQGKNSTNSASGAYWDGFVDLSAAFNSDDDSVLATNGLYTPGGIALASALINESVAGGGSTILTADTCETWNNCPSLSGINVWPSTQYTTAAFTAEDSGGTSPDDSIFISTYGSTPFLGFNFGFNGGQPFLVGKQQLSSTMPNGIIPGTDSLCWNTSTSGGSSQFNAGVLGFSIDASGNYIDVGACLTGDYTIPIRTAGIGGPATAPSGACTLNGEWVFSQDGAATRCLGGTWTTFSGGGSSPLTNKGDLYGYSTTNARIPVGPNSYVLTADSTQSLGVKWAPITGGATSIPTCADTSGSGTAQSCTTAPTFIPVAGSTIVYVTTTANTGTGLTLNVNSSSASSVSKWQGTTVLAAGDVAANEPVLAVYDGTYWNLSTIGNDPSGGGLSGGTTDFITYWTGASSIGAVGPAAWTTGHTIVPAWITTGSAVTPAPLDLQTYLESGPNIGDVFTPVAYGYFNDIAAYSGMSLINPNSTTSMSGNYNSPELLFTGDYWSGANQLDTWSILSEIGTGATPTTTLVFGHSGSPGTASVNIPYPLTVTSCTGCGGSGGNYVNLGSAVTWSGCTYSAGICTITGSNTITISAIPGTYLNLKINLNGTQANANPQYTLLTINGVTSNGTYDYGWITGGAGVGITNGGDNGKTDMYVCPLTQSAVSLETGVGGGEITIFNYARTTVSKMLNYQCTMATSTGSYPNLVTWNGNGVSRPTTAVTSITFYTPYGDNMVGTISIYGTN